MKKILLMFLFLFSVIGLYSQTAKIDTVQLVKKAAPKTYQSIVNKVIKDYPESKYVKNKKDLPEFISFRRGLIREQCSALYKLMFVIYNDSVFKSKYILDKEQLDYISNLCFKEYENYYCAGLSGDEYLACLNVDWDITINVMLELLKKYDKSKIVKYDITGFGKLKLGSSVSDIIDVNKAIKVTSNYDFVTKTHYFGVVAELITDTLSVYKLDESYYNKDVRVFYLNDIKVTDNVEIKKVYLTFYKDKLIKIKSVDMNTSFTDALCLKYPPLTIFSKNDYSNKNVKRFYNIDSDINCYIEDSNKYGKIETTILLENSKYVNLIDKEELIIKERIEKIVELKKKESLNSL